MSEVLRVRRGNIHRDRQIPRKLFRYSLHRGKRYYVGRPVLAAEATVQPPHLAIGSEQNADIGLQPYRFARLCGEPCQAVFLQPINEFFDRDQFLPQMKTGGVSTTSSRDRLTIKFQQLLPT